MREAILLSYDCFHLERPDENAISEKELTAMLATYLNEVIDRNINDIFNILYRVDVDENKLNHILFGNIEDKTVGELLAELIIERQKQKIYYRNMYKEKS